MWVRFRCQAQRLMISQLIDQKEAGSLDQFETYFSDFLEAEQLTQLKNEYQQTIQFSDIKEMINQALISSRRTNQSLNFYETLQAQIIEAAFNSSDNLTHNLCDNILDYLAKHIDPKNFFDENYPNKMQRRALEKQNAEHAIQLRLAAHVAITLLMNGRLSIDSWNPSVSGSLDSVWTVRNYNFIVQTYFDYLTYPRDLIERPLKQAILYIGFILGPDQQKQAYVNFLLTVSDTKDLNTLG